MKSLKDQLSSIGPATTGTAYTVPTMEVDEQPEQVQIQPEKPKRKPNKTEKDTILQAKRLIEELLQAETPAQYILAESLKINANYLFTDNENSEKWLNACLTQLGSYCNLTSCADIKKAANKVIDIQAKQADQFNKLATKRLNIQKQLDRLTTINTDLNRAYTDLYNEIALLNTTSLPENRPDNVKVTISKQPDDLAKTQAPSQKAVNTGMLEAVHEDTEQETTAEQIQKAEPLKAAATGPSFIDEFNRLPRTSGVFSNRKHIAFDFEVFAKYWLMVALVMEDNQFYYIDNTDDLRQFYIKNANNVWLGYNNSDYDNYILKLALLGATNATLKECNDYLISGILNDEKIDTVYDGRGRRYLKLIFDAYPQLKEVYYRIDLISCDLMGAFQKARKLKEREAYTGQSIVETTIPFNYPDELTDDQKAEVKYYCANDVKFTAYIAFKQFDYVKTLETLVDRYRLPLTDLGRTKAALSAIVLQATGRKRTDQYNLHYPTYGNCPDCEQLKAFFTDPRTHSGENKQLQLDIGGVKVLYGFNGGTHAALENYSAKGQFYHLDVTSYYPSLMVKYGLLSRNTSKSDLFASMLEDRVKAKKAGDKITADALKLILNSTNGAASAQFNDLYDPLQYNLVCQYGHIFITQLANELKDKCKIVQINTDAIDIQITDTPLKDLEPIIQAWESNTGMKLGREPYEILAQRDVNNYIKIHGDKVEGKGDYGNPDELHKNKHNEVIIYKAIVNLLQHGTPIEDTINSATSLIDFQYIATVTNAYSGILHNGQPLTTKVNRVFASNRPDDGGLQLVKQTEQGPKLSKATGTPDKIFINNDDITSAAIPEYLNRQYYIDKATRAYNMLMGIKTTAAKKKLPQQPDLDLTAATE